MFESRTVRISYYLQTNDKQRLAIVPSHLVLQTELEKTHSNGFGRGQMRGDLQGQNGDVNNSVINEQRNHCHRSDRKRWRCARQILLCSVHTISKPEGS